MAVPGVSPGDGIQVVLGCGTLHLKVLANMSCVNAAVRSRGPRIVRFHSDFPSDPDDSVFVPGKLQIVARWDN